MMLETISVPNPYDYRDGMDASPSHEVEVSQLSADLLRDFYQSFRLAQNEAAIQPPIYTLLAAQHQAAGHQPLLTEALQLAGSEVERLLPPAHHTATTPEARNDRETGFQAMWDDYSGILLGHRASTRPLELVVDDMLVQDLHYQHLPRPNRSGKQDPHESMIREYILGDRLNGSAQLLAVRDQLRATLLTSAGEDYTDWMKQQFRTLADSWEANHPGHAFMTNASAPGPEHQAGH